MTYFNCLYYFCDEQYGTALIFASEAGHHECVSILVANGADVNAVGEVKWATADAGKCGLP